MYWGQRLVLALTIALALSTLAQGADLDPSTSGDTDTLHEAGGGCKDSKRFCYLRRSTDTKPVAKRGIPARPGDIEVMGFYGALLAIPSLLSVMGIVTNYNLQKSYFNSQLKAQYYRNERAMLRAHAAQLAYEQEQKFAKAGQTWNGMIYDDKGHVNPGALMPSFNGHVLAPTPDDPPKKSDDDQAGSSKTGLRNPPPSTDPSHAANSSNGPADAGSGTNGPSNAANSPGGPSNAADSPTGPSNPARGPTDPAGPIASIGSTEFPGIANGRDASDAQGGVGGAGTGAGSGEDTFGGTDQGADRGTGPTDDGEELKRDS